MGYGYVIKAGVSVIVRVGSGNMRQGSKCSAFVGRAAV